MRFGKHRQAHRDAGALPRKTVNLQLGATQPSAFADASKPKSPPNLWGVDLGEGNADAVV
jgi:hypothetical protein